MTTFPSAAENAEADYIVTGSWSAKAQKEVIPAGAVVGAGWVFSAADTMADGSIPNFHLVFKSARLRNMGKPIWSFLNRLHTPVRQAALTNQSR